MKRVQLKRFHPGTNQIVLASAVSTTRARGSSGPDCSCHDHAGYAPGGIGVDGAPSRAGIEVTSRTAGASTGRQVEVDRVSPPIADLGRRLVGHRLEEAGDAAGRRRGTEIDLDIAARHGQGCLDPCSVADRAATQAGGSRGEERRTLRACRRFMSGDADGTSRHLDAGGANAEFAIAPIVSLPLVCLSAMDRRTTVTPSRVARQLHARA
jgi:hypothetical protein